MEYLDPHDIWTPGPNIPDPFWNNLSPFKTFIVCKSSHKINYGVYVAIAYQEPVAVSSMIITSSTRHFN